jgi:hypothetical protein
VVGSITLHEVAFEPAAVGRVVRLQRAQSKWCEQLQSDRLKNTALLLRLAAPACVGLALASRGGGPGAPPPAPPTLAADRGP